MRDRIAYPKHMYLLISKPVTFYIKRNFTDMTKRKILRWSIISGNVDGGDRILKSLPMETGKPVISYWEGGQWTVAAEIS